ncbi:MAG: 4Fe-4S dicluster domain-containing protein [Candidatus Thorarchaeota archaeon]|nr:4Fe-4S dicluster domain-containing protein [Candidatus Thorarchaeota archaeon]
MTQSWGQFKSFEGRQFKALDAEFTAEVGRLLGGQDLSACFQCAKCSAGCTVSDKVNIQVHELMRMLLFGLREVLETDMVWLCTTCYTCQERCPQGIEITDIIFGLKNMAFRKGIAPAGYLGARKGLYDTGRLYEATDWEREDLGLDPVPRLDVRDTQKMLDSTGLMKLEESED